MPDSSLSTRPVVERSSDREWVSFSPTSQFAFVASGGLGLPEFFEERSAHGDGPPLHRHPWPSWELVISGTIRVRIEDSDYTLNAGDTIYTPSGLPHAYVVESNDAHIVGIGLSEGRFPVLQTQAGPLFMADGGPDMAGVTALAGQAGLEILGPPLQATDA